MAIASKEIKNISSLETEIGNLEFLVPDMVSGELKRMSKGINKKKVSHLVL
jgi:rRNA-processing protein FCF1